MSAKKFQKIELDSKPSPSKADAQTTTKQDHTNESGPANYGERIALATVPYEGQRFRSVNCTVNAAELQAGLLQQRKNFEEYQARNEEFRRVKRGKRTISHDLPPEESYREDGSMVSTPTETTTTRKEH